MSQSTLSKINIYIIKPALSNNTAETKNSAIVLDLCFALAFAFLGFVKNVFSFITYILYQNFLKKSIKFRKTQFEYLTLHQEHGLE